MNRPILPEGAMSEVCTEFDSSVGAKLDELAQLRPNWDGYNAPPIDSRILEAARVFIKALPKNLVRQPRVVPMSTGNFQLEWHYGSKILELEFETPQTIHFLQWHPEAGVEKEATFLAADLPRALDLIQWFMNRNPYPWCAGSRVELPSAGSLRQQPSLKK